MQSDGLNSALSPVVYGDIALSINTITLIETDIAWGEGLDRGAWTGIKSPETKVSYAETEVCALNTP